MFKKKKYQIIVSISLALVVVVFFVFNIIFSPFKADEKNPPKSFYISSSGSNNNSGTIAAPFLTIQKAQQAIRELKSGGNFNGATVYFRGGTYLLDSTITFDANDSGTAEAPISYKNYPDEKPIIVGSKNISGWQLKPGSQSIYQADLTGQSLSGKKIIDLFLNKDRQVLARTPNKVVPNYSRTDPYEGNWLFASDANDKSMNNALKYNAEDLAQDIVQIGDTALFTPPNPAQVEIYTGYEWSSNVVDVASVNTTNHQIDVTGVPVIDSSFLSYGVTNGNRYSIMNYANALDAPDEWYQDRTNDLLYFIPSEPLDDSDKISATTGASNAITLTDAQYINFDGLDFEEFPGDVFYLSNSNHISIENTVIANNYNSAILIMDHSYNILINNNHIHNIGISGIYIGLDTSFKKTLTSSEIVISNNKIHDIGDIPGSVQIRGQTNLPSAVSFARYDNDDGFSGHKAVGITVSHNEIFNTPRSAIMGAGNNNIIEYNKIYNTVLLYHDAGAIEFNTRSWIDQGNIIRNNYISNTHGYGRSIWGDGNSPLIFNTAVNGIYFDDYTSGNEVINNIIVNSGQYGISNHRGRDNTYRNNIIIQKTGYGISGMAFDIANLNSIKTDDNEVFEKLYADVNNLEQNGFDRAKYFSQYPGLANIPAKDTVTKSSQLMENNTFENNVVEYSGSTGSPYKITNFSNNQTIDYNLFWGGSNDFKVLVNDVWPQTILTFSKWQTDRGFDLNSIIANPLFVDPLAGESKHDNFTLQANSPAFTFGFNQIDTSQIGLLDLLEPPPPPVIPPPINPPPTVNPNKTTKNDTQSPVTETSDTQPSDIQPSDTQSTDAQSFDAQSTDTETSDTQSFDTQPTDTQSSDAQSSNDIANNVEGNTSDTNRLNDNEEKPIVSNSDEINDPWYSKTIIYGAIAIIFISLFPIIIKLIRKNRAK